MKTPCGHAYFRLELHIGGSLISMVMWLIVVDRKSELKRTILRVNAAFEPSIKLIIVVAPLLLSLYLTLTMFMFWLVIVIQSLGMM